MSSLRIKYEDIKDLITGFKEHTDDRYTQLYDEWRALRKKISQTESARNDHMKNGVGFLGALFMPKRAAEWKKTNDALEKSIISMRLQSDDDRTTLRIMNEYSSTLGNMIHLGGMTTDGYIYLDVNATKVLHQAEQWGRSNG